MGLKPGQGAASGVASAGRALFSTFCSWDDIVHNVRKSKEEGVLRGGGLEPAALTLFHAGILLLFIVGLSRARGVTTAGVRALFKALRLQVFRSRKAIYCRSAQGQQ